MFEMPTIIVASFLKMEAPTFINSIQMHVVLFVKTVESLLKKVPGEKTPAHLRVNLPAMSVSSCV